LGIKVLDVAPELPEGPPVSGLESDGNITISVGDDGWGMDRKGVLAFSAVFRSVKQGNPDVKGFLGVAYDPLCTAKISLGWFYASGYS
jgi:hypothetical protein